MTRVITIRQIEQNALVEAIEKAGGQSALAAKLNALGYLITQQGISLWLRRGLPAHWAIPVERVTSVSKERLKASIFQAAA